MEAFSALTSSSLRPNRVVIQSPASAARASSSAAHCWSFSSMDDFPEPLRRASANIKSMMYRTRGCPWSGDDVWTPKKTRILASRASESESESNDRLRGANERSRSWQVPIWGRSMANKPLTSFSALLPATQTWSRVGEQEA